MTRGDQTNVGWVDESAIAVWDGKAEGDRRSCRLSFKTVIALACESAIAVILLIKF